MSEDPHITLTKKEAVLASLNDGASVLAACKAASVGRRTFYDWKKTDEDFAVAVTASKKAAIDVVVDALFKRAKGYEYEERTYKAVVSKNNVLKNERLAEVKKKQIAPDTVACIFFLANRDPENWKSVNNVNLNHSGVVDTGKSDAKILSILESYGFEVPEEDRKKMLAEPNAAPAGNDNGDNGDNGTH